jgi:hypothetical protein
LQRLPRARGRAWGPPLRFWLSFTALNLLIFLPAWWFNRAEATFLPAAHSPRELLGWRENMDPFRLSAELTLLALLWHAGAGRGGARPRRLLRALPAITAVFALLYTLYETLSLTFYAADPVFYAQAALLRGQMGFLLAGLNLPWTAVAAGVLGVAAAALLLRALLRGVLAPLPEGRAADAVRGPLLGLLLLVLAAALLNGRALAAPRSVVSCLTCKLVENGAASRALAERVHALDDLPVAAPNPAGYALLQRPDVYLIFVESYGSILLSDPLLRRAYQQQTERLTAELAAAGWHSASALSESPTWGGGSWMAYTSALLGLRVDSHPAYLSLLEQFSDGRYPTLGRALHDLGYRVAHTTPIAAELPPAEQAAHERFYGADRWLTYADLGYSGAHYGWGPSPPDQFALAQANALLHAESDAPLFFFMLTQNSHYPWQEVPPLTADWRAHNDPTAPPPQIDLSAEQGTGSRADYLAAISYELDMLAQFVREEVPAEALVLLVGDHQPGYISRRAGGFATPVHVLSQDARLPAGLAELGFTAGLRLPRQATAVMGHEDVYGLLLRLLAANDGRGDGVLPPLP